MSTEIEIKLRLTDPERVRTRLDELGAAPGGTQLQQSTIFDTPDGRLRQADCGLRVRRGGMAAQTPVTLTYKGPRQPGRVKAREELELELADAAILHEILDRLGFRPTVRYEVRRETWRVEPCVVTIDELPQLGWTSGTQAGRYSPGRLIRLSKPSPN
jgi:adenylate cyclase class 2